MGGLGNQMFEYAAGLAVAERHRTVLKVDVGWYGADMSLDAINRYNMHCLNVPVQFATANEIARMKGGLTRQEKLVCALAKSLRLPRLVSLFDKPGDVHFQKQWTYYPEFEEVPNERYLYGNFQSEKFFSPVAPLIRRQFTLRYPPTPEVEALAARIKSGPSVAVHFRRGDYLTNAENARVMGIVGHDYYNRAIELLRARMPSDTTYYFFSDEIELVQKEYRPTVPAVFVNIFQSGNFYDKIRLMGLCEHNIIANSTFSWWAAWLNANPDKTVIAPRRWFGEQGHPDEDMCPEGWERV